MGRTLDEIIAALPAKERRRVEERTAELVAEEMSLQDLRKAMKKTQVSIAKRLHVGQDGVSKIEQRADMLLSTLRGYVKALGGELDLVAKFPDRPPVRLTEIGVLAEHQKEATGKRRPRKRAVE